MINRKWALVLFPAQDLHRNCCCNNRIVPAFKLYDKNLNGPEARVSPLMSLQSVKRLQLDQAAGWLVTCRNYSCLGLDGELREEGKLVPPSPLLYLLFTSLHFDAYCYSCDTFWCWVYMTSVWLCSKMHNELFTPSFCDSGCLSCAHCRLAYIYSTSST